MASTYLEILCTSCVLADGIVGSNKTTKLQCHPFEYLLFFDGSFQVHIIGCNFSFYYSANQCNPLIFLQQSKDRGILKLEPRPRAVTIDTKCALMTPQVTLHCDLSSYDSLLLATKKQKFKM